MINKSVYSQDECKRHLDLFFAQKVKKIFRKDSNTKLPERWQKHSGMANKVKAEKIFYLLFLRNKLNEHFTLPNFSVKSENSLKEVC